MSTSADENIDNIALWEEVEAINSIYDIHTLTVQSPRRPNSTSAVLDFPLHAYSFRLAFPHNYPDTAPQVEGVLSAGASAKGEAEAAVRVLREVVQRVWRPGQVCLFDLIEEAHPLLEIAVRHGQADHESDGSGGGSHEDTDAVCPIPKLGDASLGPEIPPPSWTSSEPITCKRSVFVARCAKVSSKDEALSFVKHLKSTDKRVASATHNITAYRISSESGIVVQDCDDDGETAAGGRLLHLMQLMDGWNVVAVVTRWYGGTLLGADRFRIINTVARDALVHGGFVQEPKEAGKKKKSKKS